MNFEDWVKNNPDTFKLIEKMFITAGRESELYGAMAAFFNAIMAIKEDDGK